MVSIIIPAYNRQDTIRKSIESVLNQSYQDFEIIIVDDGSTDKTLDIINNISDSRIRIIQHKVNQGASTARNTGIYNAKGELIAFQDSDDEWLENKLELQINLMDKYQCDAVACGSNKFYGYKKIYFPGYYIHNDRLKEHLFAGCIITTQTILAKKVCFENIKFDPSLPAMEDWDLTIRLSLQFNIKFINKALVNRFEQATSLTTNHNKNITALKAIAEKYHDIDKNLKIKQSSLRMIGWHKMRMNDFSYNYYKDAMFIGGFDWKCFVRYCEFLFRKIASRF